MPYGNRLGRAAVLVAAVFAHAVPAHGIDSVPRAEPEEAQAEAPPSELYEVPPPEAPRQPTEQDARTAALVEETLAAQARRLGELMAQETTAIARAVQLDAELVRQETALDEARRRRDLAQQVLAAKRDEAKRRAVAAYVGAPAARFDSLMESEDLNALVRRAGLVDAVTARDQAALRDFARTKALAESDLVEEQSRAEAARALAEQARKQAADATATRLRAQGDVDALRHGGTVAVAGFAFPVDEPFSFVDTFGAPRMTGTTFEHTHQGTDVFAPHGTPLRAVERGVVTRIGTDTLGGRKLWLVGASGSRYYYAHLSGFAPGLVDGVVVEAGTLLGFVGQTGNAQGTPPHLHFELHPGGGPAVNPYPLLRASADARRAVAVAG